MNKFTQNTIDKEGLFEKLANDGVLLTVNNRLTTYFTSEYDQWQANLGHEIWESPNILPLSRWLKIKLNTLNALGLSDCHLLSATQEKIIWTDILEKDAYELYMMQASTIAKNVMQAWQLIQQWQIPKNTLSSNETVENQSLLKWKKKFESLSKKNKWLSQTLLIEEITTAIQKELFSIPSHIIFAGFQDPNRLHEKMIHQLNKKGCLTYFYQHQNINTTIRAVTCNDFQTELITAASWAKDLLKDNPNQSISIVIPSINTERQLIEYNFNKVLHPEKLSPPPYQHKSLFNLSLGLPLSDYPLVNDALLSLELLKYSIALDDLNKIFNSYFIFKNNHRNVTNLSDGKLAGIDILLRSHARKKWTLKSLILFLNTTQMSNDIDYIIDLLEKIHVLKNNLSTTQPSEKWAETFLTLLKIIGWPGQRQLDSHEYQQSERLLKLINEFTHIDDIKFTLTLSEATHLFKQMVKDTIFQVQSEQTPIQISGNLEASDQQYDHLWLMSLDDESLPARANPNPLIPFDIQLKYNVPHCSAEREYEYAHTMIEHFKSNATNVIFSYSCRDGDRELRPSSFIKQLIESSEPFNFTPEDLKLTSHSNSGKESELEIYSDNKLPALADHQVVRGGSGLLTQQANCPFKANATFRLMASEPEDSFEGVSPIDWGNQVHKILEKTWSNIKTSRLLESYDDEDLEQLITPIIDDTMKSYSYKRPDLYQEHFLKLEKKRLLKLIINWLSLEKKRQQEFKVVEQEQDKTIEIGGLILKIKADRVDQLESGKHVIIDYKTGKLASSKSWLEDDITEPQLPLYSLDEEYELAALSIAKVNDKQCKFTGIAMQDDILPSVKVYQSDEDTNNTKNDWQSLKEIWRTKLTAIADSYRQGEANIDIKSCNYCSYAALCRKHQLQSEIENINP